MNPIEERKAFVRASCEEAVKKGIRIESGAIGGMRQGHCCPLGACVLELDGGDALDLYASAYERIGSTFGYGLMRGFDGIRVSSSFQQLADYAEGLALGKELRIKYLPKDED